MLTTRFNAAEILELAKDIEKEGYDFYKTQAGKTEDKELKQLFLDLAADEQEHYDIFNELSRKVKKEVDEDLDYIYDQEVSAYLSSLVEFTVFPPDSDSAIKPETPEKILLMAIMAEKDSILFYQEMLPYNKGTTADTLKRLIAEEKQHLVDLTSYKKELT